MRIDHVAIAVNNIELALKNYEKLFRINQIHIEDVPNEKVKVAILNLEDTRIELMEPTAKDSPINKFLDRNGEGLHHLAITADNIQEDVSRACSNGIRMLGDVRKGSYNRRITFFHPKSMNGVLVEMCEDSRRAH
jgi:methylmalonyl-CoA/ethylmalonyl-CoA epimerase